MTRRKLAMWVGGLAIALGASTATAQITRTVLQQKDLSTPGREVITAKAEIPAGGAAGLHTHPGDEISYVVSGNLDLVINGKTTTYKAGEAFHVPQGVVHDAKASGGPAVVIANYVIEKGKPATTAVK